MSKPLFLLLIIKTNTLFFFSSFFFTPLFNLRIFCLFSLTFQFNLLLLYIKMSYSRDDAIPLTDQASSSGPSVAHGIKQAKGEFATSGAQPSFALELDISTIEHVCKLSDNNR